MAIQLGRAFTLVRKTLPYIGYRAAVYGAICAVIAALLLVLALVGRIFGGGAALILFLIALVGGGIGWRLLRDYVLYLLQAGHIAVIVELIENGALPEGVSQTGWGKDKVMGYFKEISVLALVDQLVKGIIAAVNRTLFNVMNLLPVPGLDGAAKLIQRIVYFSLTYVDEAILAYTFKTRNENVFDAAKSGVILYCQSWKSILKNAVIVTLLSYVFVIVATVIFLIPLGAIALSVPSAWAATRFFLFVFALVLGVAAKWILFDPIACTSTLLVFLAEAEGNVPNPEWEARIESVSDKFRELKAKAADKMRGADPTPAPAGTSG